MQNNYLVDGLYDDGLESSSLGPAFTNDDSGKLRQTYRNVIQKLADYFKKELDIEVEDADFTGVRVLFGDPKKYREGRGLDEQIILGLYNPARREIVINDIYGDHRLRDLDLENNLNEGDHLALPSIERVLTEELVHHLQKKYGTMSRANKKLGEKARGYLEGSAAKISEDVLGEPTPIYGKWKRDYDRIERIFGKRRAFFEPALV